MVHRRHIALAAAAMALGIPGGAAAQTGQVTLQAHRHIVAVGEPLQVTVTIVVNGQMGYERYLPPTFDGFQVSGGGVTTQNIEVINWKVRRRESRTYTLVATRAGTFKVGPAAVQVGRRQIKSGTLSIKVRPGASGAAGAADAGAGAPQVAVPRGRGDQRVFLAATVAPEQVYVGQQVLATWYLFTQSDVLGFHVTEHPTTDGFWSEDLRSPSRLQFEQKLVGNRLYYAAVIARKALFPQKPGQLSLGSMKAQVRTVEQFVSSAVDRQSEPVAIEVRPLPEAGQPPGFPMGNVGQLDIMASLDRRQVKAGEGVTLRLVVRGKGNLRQITLPPVDGLDGFKVYKPKVDHRLELQGGVSGEKVVEYLLLPVKAGQLTVPALTLDYFDPVAGAYREATTDALQLQVTGKMPTEGPGGASKKNVLGPSIRPPRPPAHLAHRSERPLYASHLYLALLVLPVALLVVVSGGERLRARLARETRGSLRRAAGRRTRQHLRRARGLVDAEEIPAFYGALAAGVRSILDHRLDVSIEGLTREELARRMRRQGFAPELVDSVTDCLDRCDAARFAPSASDRDERAEALERTERLVDALGRARLGRGPS